MASNYRSSGLAVSAAGESAVLAVPRWAGVLAQVCAILVIGIAFLAVTGWLSGNRTMTSFRANLFPMAPSTTIAFLACGGSLFLLASSRKKRHRNIIILITIGLVPVLARLIEYAIHADLGFIEQQLPPLPDSFSLAPTGRMAFPTAISFVLTAGAMVGLLFARSKRAIRFLIAGLAAAVMVVGLIFLLGYAYGLPLLRNTSSVPMALNTSIAFLLLGIGLSALGIGYEIAERRQTTDSLSLLATIIESSHDAIISFTPAGIIKTWNIAAEQMYGYKAEEAIGQPISMLSLPERIAISPANVESLNRGERIAAYQTTLKHKYGRLIDVSASAFPLYDARGRVIASAMITCDITEQAQMTREKQAMQDRLQAMMDNTSAVVFLKDLDGRYIAVNQHFERLFNPTRMNLVGKTDFDLFPADLAECFQKNDRAVLAADSAMQIEEKAMHEDGIHSYISNKFVLKDSSGRPYAVGGIATDITEHKRAESEITNFFRLSVNMLCIANLDGYFVKLNPSWETTLGFTLDELTARPFIEFVHPDDREATIAQVRRLASDNDVVSFENRYLCKDGSYKTLLWNSTPSVELGLIYATAVDITERAQAATVLRQSEEKSRALFESSPAGIVVVDHLDHIVLVNAAAEDLFGYRREEILGHSVDILVPMQHRSSHVDKRASYDRSPESRRMGLGRDIQARKKDGTEFPAEIGLSPIETSDGTFTMAFIVDITARKRAEAELALEVVRAQTLLDLHQIDSAPPEQLLDFVLEASLKMTQSELSFVGLLDEAESVMTIYRWSNGAMSQCATSEKPLVYPLCEAGLWGDCVRQRQPLVINDYAEPHPSKRGLPEGHVPIRRFLAVPVFEKERIVAVAAVANKVEPYAASDIRALTSLMNKLWLILNSKKAEEAIQRLNADLSRQSTALQAANKELEAFSYSVSHDLRAPLRAIGGFSQVLLEDHAGNLDNAGRSCLDRICRAANDMGVLIDDVLSLSRVTRKEMRSETLDLSAIAAKIVDDLRKLNPERNVDFAIAEGMRGVGDPHLMRIALKNLLHNAWKYTGKHRTARIEIGVEEQDGQTVFFVHDDGAGFDMKYADKLFKPFQRLHLSDEFEGSGVGLATVQRIVHRHGGRVWATAAVEKGATFYFTCEPQEVLVHA